MSAIPKPWISPAEYLAVEREATERSEYLFGEVFAMAGTTIRHGQIQSRLFLAIGSKLDGCEIFSNETRVGTADETLYSYPDIMVACGELKVRDDSFDTLLNPILIIEILSPSTEAYERNAKFAAYNRILSLEEYVLVAQDRPRIESFYRESEEWTESRYEGLDAVLFLKCLGLTLPLATIYRHIEFGEEKI